MDQFVDMAVAEKISVLTTETYPRARTERADADAFRAILDKVPPAPAAPRGRMMLLDASPRIAGQRG